MSGPRAGGRPRVVVIGANGQLGSDLVDVLRHRWEVVPLTHADLEICDASQVRTALREHRPDVVMNTAAFHRVDDCEREVERAFLVNAVAVRYLAEACRDVGATLVHFSTDYVFDGSRRTPYAEDDAPSPRSVYAISKLAGELAVRATVERHFVVRTSGLYGLRGSSVKGGNFVETMLRLQREGRPIRVVDDQELTPTYTRHVARKVAQLVETTAYGLYHVTNAGSCTWYQFARRIFALTGLPVDLRPQTTAEAGRPAPRPAYSVLAHAGLARLGLADMPPWDEALREFLAARGLCHE